MFSKSNSGSKHTSKKQPTSAQQASNMTRSYQNNLTNSRSTTETSIKMGNKNNIANNRDNISNIRSANITSNNRDYISNSRGANNSISTYNNISHGANITSNSRDYISNSSHDANNKSKDFINSNRGANNNNNNNISSSSSSSSSSKNFINSRVANNTSNSRGVSNFNDSSGKLDNDRDTKINYINDSNKNRNTTTAATINNNNNNATKSVILYPPKETVEDLINPTLKGNSTNIKGQHTANIDGISKISLKDNSSRRPSEWSSINNNISHRNDKILGSGSIGAVSNQTITTQTMRDTCDMKADNTLTKPVEGSNSLNAGMQHTSHATTFNVYAGDHRSKPIGGINSFSTYPASITQHESAKNPRGLRNLGNTCFMNSIIQCLKHTTDLNKFYTQKQYKNVLQKNCNGKLSNAFALVLQAISSEGYDPVEPKQLKYEISIVAPRFSGYSQHDAQEFLRFLLNDLHDEINAAEPKNRIKINDYETLKEATIRFKSYEDSLVVDMFAGMLGSTIVCSKCKTESTVYDPFLDLSLPIPKGRITPYTSSNYSYAYDSAPNSGVTLTQCFEAFLSEERLTGAEKPYCEICRDTKEATKTLSVVKSPPYLVLQLKRFSGYTTRSKLNTPVAFDEEIVVTVNDERKELRKVKYSLYAMSSHFGSLYGGHYVAYCKDEEGTWWVFNDTSVHRSSWNSVSHKEAYILFYHIVS